MVYLVEYDCAEQFMMASHPMVEFYLLTFPRFPVRKKEHKSYFGKNRTHDFRTINSSCAGYLLDHSGDEQFGDDLAVLAILATDDSREKNASTVMYATSITISGSKNANI